MTGEEQDEGEESAGEPSVSSFGDLEEALFAGRRASKPSPPEGADEEAEESYFADLLSELGGTEAHTDEPPGEAAGEFDWDGGGSGIISDSKSQAILELLSGSKNVLLLGPLQCPAEYEIGTTLMRGPDGDPFNLLLVTMSQSPDERLRICRSYLDSVPGETRIIGVGSNRGGAEDTIETPDGSVSVSLVSNPGDLKRIGIMINQTMNEWDQTGRRTVMCFHSLTALLQYVEDERRIFRFLSILRGRIQNSDGHAHYHMERTAHDESVIEMIRTLFDAIITYDEDGSVSIDS